MTIQEPDVLSLIRDFVDGNDRSMAAAGRIEGALDTMFGDEEPYASLVLALASYSPIGGEFLYDEEAILKLMTPVFQLLLKRWPDAGAPT